MSLPRVMTVAVAVVAGVLVHFVIEHAPSSLLVSIKMSTQILIFSENMEGINH